MDTDDAKKEIDALRQQIKKSAEDAVGGNTLAKACADVPAIPNVNIKLRRTLKGHLAKIYAMQWSETGPTLASASQDGKMIVWNAVTCLKMNAINLPSTWVMACGFSPSGEFVASGGLDNICSVWNLRNGNPTKVSRELVGHDGFLSCCRFIDNGQIITSSGDHTCALWDIEQAQKIKDFKHHTHDVLNVALNPEKTIFVSSSCDASAVAWDVRSGKATHIFEAHDKDVNTACFMSNGHTFATGSEDNTCRLFDLRSWGEINRYEGACPVNSLAFSASGRLLYAAYADNNTCHVWDALKAEKKGSVSGHEAGKRISCVGVSSDGNALCTAGWDAVMKIWT
jgi:guanine nucleotide-binding protein G(I)/G(S)/G(T) subunit beta-1